MKQIDARFHHRAGLIRWKCTSVRGKCSDQGVVGAVPVACSGECLPRLRQQRFNIEPISVVVDERCLARNTDLWSAARAKDLLDERRAARHRCCVLGGGGFAFESLAKSCSEIRFVSHNNTPPPA